MLQREEVMARIRTLRLVAVVRSTEEQAIPIVEALLEFAQSHGLKIFTIASDQQSQRQLFISFNATRFKPFSLLFKIACVN
mgnify:CR=1 FL=1